MAAALSHTEAKRIGPKQNKIERQYMWIFSKWGIVSIVKKGGKGDEWQVRSRSREDLTNLIQAAELRGQKVIEAFGSDYRYRLVIKADELTQLFDAFESGIDYPNYKTRLSQTPGQEKNCQAAHTVWRVIADAHGGAYQSAPRAQRSLLSADAPEALRSALNDGEAPASDVVRGKRGNGRKRQRDDQRPLDL